MRPGGTAIDPALGGRDLGTTLGRGEFPGGQPHGQLQQTPRQMLGRRLGPHGPLLCPDVLILGVMTSGFTFIRIDAYYQEMVKGAIIVAAVVADQYRQRHRRG